MSVKEYKNHRLFPSPVAAIYECSKCDLSVSDMILHDVLTNNTDIEIDTCPENNDKAVKCAQALIDHIFGVDYGIVKRQK